MNDFYSALFLILLVLAAVLGVCLAFKFYSDLSDMRLQLKWKDESLDSYKKDLDRWRDKYFKAVQSKDKADERLRKVIRLRFDESLKYSLRETNALYKANKVLRELGIDLTFTMGDKS